MRGARRAAIQELGGIQDYYDVVPIGLRRAVYNYVPMKAPPLVDPARELQITRLSPGFPLWNRPWELHMTVLDGATTQVFFTCNAQRFTFETTRRFLGRLAAI